MREIEEIERRREEWREGRDWAWLQNQPQRHKVARLFSAKVSTGRHGMVASTNVAQRPAH